MAASASLVLASGSPRRRELLTRVGFSIEVLAADIDEAIVEGEDATSYARRLAGEKAAAVALERPGRFILAADTIVVSDRAVLGKPDGVDDAREMLTRLVGRDHRVTTAMCARAATGESVIDAVTTTVSMRAATAPEIEGYLESGEWRGKAGGYAIQGIAAAWVTAVRGSVTNVIGLPLAETIDLLARIGGPAPDFARGQPA